MRIKIDKNLPEDLVELLAQRGCDVDSVPSEGLAGRVDTEVWQAAQSSNRLLVTQDLDFSDIRIFQPGTHAGVLLIRLHEPSRRRLIQRVVQLIELQDAQTWSRCVVIATDHKVRVRRPSTR